MATNRFLIAPYDKDSGLQTDVRPWLVPDTAFSTLDNAYVFRGRVRKRFGSRWMGNSQLVSRFRIDVGDTDVSGDASGSLPYSPIGIGTMFSINDVVFTVNALGTPANMLVGNGLATTATLNTTSGAFNFVNVRDTNGVVISGATIYFYPSLPVMGLITFENNNVNDETIIGFDTQFAYQYNSGWERLATGAATWSGDNSEFFWGTTWTGANAFEKIFFVTNFNENEQMRSYDGTTWSNFRPQITSSDYLNSARILVVFKNRLVAFNTWEGSSLPGDNYVNRCRYSQIGSPLDSNGWRQDIPGRGNAIDAPTTEAIITVEFIKDRLIVFFERSTWELVYTGNQAYPFTWQQINTELGAESTFSVVPFDKVALGVGNVGIHACNGSNVERIDDKIPDVVFDVRNGDEGVFRVYGIRDYYVEMVYWTFPNIDGDSDFPFPNRVLVYNYKNGTWAFNNDSITCFGYYQPQTGITWSDSTINWSSPVTWGSGSLQAKFRQVIGGNQQGYTFIIDADERTNASVLQITDLTALNNIVTITSINHNLRVGEYVYISGIDDQVGNLGFISNHIFQITSITVNTFTFIYEYSEDVLSGIYLGGGLISRVSKINIKTKEYNFYAKQGRNAYVSKVDFMVDKTQYGQLQVDFYVSTSLSPLLQDSGSAGTGSLLGTGNLDTFAYPTIPFEANTSRLWHPVYFQADGEVVQLELTMNNEQMISNNVRSSDFQLHAMCIYAQPTSYRFQ